MNTPQKIFVMVAVGSAVVFPITVLSNIYFSFASFNLMFGAITNMEGGHATNWLGIIAVFNVVVSSVGFFLFKDK